MQIKLMELMARDDKQNNVEHDIKEKEKVGTLRAGNTGMVQDDGAITGKCHRLSYLRYKGVQLPHDDDRDIMFEFGRVANENLILDKLVRQLPRNMKILREGEIPTGWTTPAGVQVTGSPDFVLQIAGENVLGIELKMVSSVWTAVSVMCKSEPSYDHLLQAAHYMWQMGCPWKILYVSPVDYAIPFIPKGETWPSNIDGKLKEIIEFYDNGKPKKINPFRLAYDLRFDDDGCLEFRREDESGFYTRSPISIRGIELYYQTVATIDERKELGDRPINLKATGDLATWNKCDKKYCDVSDICDQWEKRQELWLDACIKRFSEDKK